jgi:hypothetical protein
VYWLIYYHAGKLEGYRAKQFVEYEEVEIWVKEMGNKIKVIDLAESLDKD